MKSPRFLFIALLFLYVSDLHAQENQKRIYEQLLPGLNIQSPNDTSLGKQELELKESNILYSTRNFPRTGDQVVKLEASYINQGDQGENVTWDFNHLKLTGGEYELGYQVTPMSLLTGIENATMHSYMISGDSLLVYCYENPLTLVYLEKPEEVMIFPMSYKDERTGFFYGKGKYCDRMEMDVAGITYSRADSYGMLVLPENDTIYNVLRVYTAKITLTDTRPISPDFDIHSPRETPLAYDDLLKRLEQDTVYTFAETYRWYAAGSRYPVLETGSSQVVVNERALSMTNRTHVYHPVDQQIELPTDPENLAIAEKESVTKSVTGNEESITNSRFGIKTYPNPVVNELHLEFRLNSPEKAEVFVYNTQGQLLIRHDYSIETESHTETINMQHLEKGSYFLKVQAGENSENKVILKQ